MLCGAIIKGRITMGAGFFGWCGAEKA